MAQNLDIKEFLATNPSFPDILRYVEAEATRIVKSRKEKIYE